MEVQGDLAVVEQQYAELLQELADLYQVRELLRRSQTEPAQLGTDTHPSRSGRAPSRRRSTRGDNAMGGSAATTMSVRSMLRVVHGGQETETAPAMRLAQKQGTRALLQVVDGGRAAS